MDLEQTNVKQVHRLDEDLKALEEDLGLKSFKIKKKVKPNKPEEI